MLALAARNLPDAEESEELHRKYYERSPLGPPVFFLAREASSNAFVGMAALFPTSLRISGDLVPAAITGDFAIDIGHRAFGPAIPLQRACLSALAENGFRCAYGSPNPLAESIIDRVGYVDVGRRTRFVKVLRGQIVVDTYVRRRKLARLASASSAIAIDPLLPLLSRERLYRRRTSFSVEEPQRFDDRFFDLWRVGWREHEITNERNADLLNWKYEMSGDERGGRKFATLALIEGGQRVAGYIVYRVRNNVRHILDVLSFPCREVVDALLAEFILDARRHGASAISVLYFGPGNLLTARLRAFGFIPSPNERGLRVHVEQGVRFPRDLRDSSNWYFLPGDEDV